jgi:hypothetical protein
MAILYAWQECMNFFGPSSWCLRTASSPAMRTASQPPVRSVHQPDQGFAGALDDSCDPDLTEHTSLEMVRSRVSSDRTYSMPLDAQPVMLLGTTFAAS